MKHFCFIIILLTLYKCVKCENDTIAKLSYKNLVATELGVATIGYSGFYGLWYKQSEQTKFHFFDDHKEWLQIDKCGHAFGGYWLSQINTKLFNKTSLNTKQSTFLGSGIALIYMSSIEIMDGFSKDWGASLSDIIANSIGCTLFATQNILWNEQRIIYKYSYSHSQYSKYREELLGENFAEKLLKNYNATKFWLSFNINSFAKTQWMPCWLNLAIGYGADGMTGGHTNSIDSNIPNNYRTRSFFLSFDADLTKIKTKSKFLKSTLFVLNIIKLPAPTLTYSQSKFGFSIK